MKFMLALDRDVIAAWVSERLSIPGGVSQGQTREEALHEGERICYENLYP